MYFYLWWHRKKARREIPNFDELLKNAPRLAEAIIESQTNGTPAPIRAVLAYSGWRFPDNVPLLKARAHILRNDPHKNVRRCALVGLTMSSSATFGFDMYPYDAREAIQIGLEDKDKWIRKTSAKLIKEFDRNAQNLAKRHKTG